MRKQSRRQLSQEEIQTLIRMIENRDTVADCAAALKRSKNCMYHHMRQLGIKPKYSKFQDAQMNRYQKSVVHLHDELDYSKLPDSD